MLRVRRCYAALATRGRGAAPSTGFARVLAAKYYVDEVYDALIVRPMQSVSAGPLDASSTRG